MAADFSRRFNRFMIAVTLVALGVVLIGQGYRLPLEPGQKVLRWPIDIALIVVFLIDGARYLARGRERWPVWLRSWLTWVVGGTISLVVLASGLLTVHGIATIILYRQIVVLLRMIGRSRVARTVLAEVRLKPAQMLALSFLFTIGVGTYFLTLPAATADQQGASLLNALFTATSATCVTGLIVVDTSTYWSRFGQTVILILIQIGALGIMTISTSAGLLLGRRLGLRERVVLHEIFDEAMAEELIRLIRNIVKLTIVIELVGFALLVVKFAGRMPRWTETLYQAVFHSVSAFCNAGFSLASDSLMKFVDDLGVNLIISTLIILGGLGYAVLGGLSSLWPMKRSIRLGWKALSLHAKLTLVTSLVLISLGTVLFFFFEFDNTLLHLPLKDQIVAAYFQSVTARTAGFNTVDIGQLKPTTLFVLMILMFIGASPGSTGGGIKTTTVAVLILSVRSIVRQREEVEAFGRTISRTMIYKAAAIAVISLGVVLTLFLILLAVEQGDFLALAFEAVSAFGTVGLSMGITPQLTVWGKLIIITMMYVGRIGPLTLALAIGEPERRLRIAYPQGRVWIG